MSSPWTEAEFQRACSIVDSFEIAKDAEAALQRELGRSYHGFRKRRRRMVPKEKEAHAIPLFDDLSNNKVDVFETLRRCAERVEDHGKAKDYHRVEIPTDRPVAVIKSSDWHFGGMDVDYRALLEHVEILLNNDNVYMQLFGDDINNMVVHRNVSARHDIMTPDEQVAWFLSFVDETVSRGKLISVGWGNHDDEWFEKNSGISFLRFLLKHKIPYFRGMGYMDLVVGKVTYPIAFTHKTRFNSFMNPLHGNKRMEQMHKDYFGVDKPLAREVCTAHTHNPAVSWEGCIPEQRVWYIKCGTFKTNDVYSQRYFGQGKIGCPTVVYRPDRLEHICFPTPWEALTYMKGME